MASAVVGLSGVVYRRNYNFFGNHKERTMKTENLESVARKLVGPGRGILAADESLPTIEKRLKSIGVASTEENRRAYREILFTTAGVGEFVSGVILFDETIRQKTHDGRAFVEALEAMLLKPNMVLSGKDCPQQASTQEVAEATSRCMKRVVPAAVPGLVFLSGGQSDLQASENLNAMNRLGHVPWELSFSFGRALQAPVLKAWKGDPANTADAQRAFHHRAWCNSKARFGEYFSEMENKKAAA